MNTSIPALPGTTTRRLWNAFLTGRVLVAGMLVLLLILQTQGSGPLPESTSIPTTWLVTLGYLLLSVLAWLGLRSRPPTRRWAWQWLPAIGGDVLAIGLLQLLQVGNMHYTPLLALPILTVSVLGSLRLALATTSGITLILLGKALFDGWIGLPGASEKYMQTALICAGYFVVAYLSQQLAQRLAWQEQQSLYSRQAAQTQAQVNNLIIDNLSEGVLVLDAGYQVRMANPAARQLLGLADSAGRLASLQAETAWQPLRQMVDHSFAFGQAHQAHVHLLQAGLSPVALYVRTWLTTSLPEVRLDAGADEGSPLPPTLLCVMFLNDLREMEARLRTEKMAAMGRMSAAVAHEIRNPLAAIMQANALLAEDLSQPGQQRLSQMVEQNAQRLAHIAEEVLDIARVRQQMHHAQASALALDQETLAIWEEWRAQAPAQRQGECRSASAATVEFEAEHLRRVVVNLLDNALRHMGQHPDSLQLSTGLSAGQAWLQVWSDGPELEASVRKHLFEPFFSSQSRSTGLGLFICRELCQRHGAALNYQRLERPTARGLCAGNAFTLVFRQTSQPGASASLFDSIVV